MVEFFPVAQNQSLRGEIRGRYFFLQELLDSGSHKYGTFSSHRAALSLLLPGNISADPVLSRILKGCREFDLRLHAIQ
jgi:hypothetical protein